MTRQLMTGNTAAAWGARLAQADYVPAFPITPQTEIIETLSAWIGSGEMKSRMVMLESEHSMVTAAGAAATGVRVFTATSSQGLLYAMEMLYTVAGWRVPFVLVNVSRGLAAPITLEPDHNDVLAARDSGFLQTALRQLPGSRWTWCCSATGSPRTSACGCRCSSTWTASTSPSRASRSSCRTLPLPPASCPPIDPRNLAFRASQPVSQAVAVLGGSPYSYFRYEMHLAAENALGGVRRDRRRVRPASSGAATTSSSLPGRRRRGSVRHDRLLRDQGHGGGGPAARRGPRGRAGAAAPVPAVSRPTACGASWPASAPWSWSTRTSRSARAAFLHAELASALYGRTDSPPIVLASFVGGLGGRDIGAEEFYEMAAAARTATQRRDAAAAAALHRERTARGPQAPGHRPRRATRDRRQRHERQANPSSIA